MKLCDKVFRTIVAHRKGWVFSPSDLTHKFTRKQVNNALCALLKSGKIRRIARGIYDYPEYSELIGRILSPDVEKAFAAYARRDKLTLEIHGETALNYFYLSTQIVARNIYMSSGKSRIYTLFNGTQLEFRRVPPRDIGFKYRISSVVVTALKRLGKDRIDNEVIAKIREQINPNMRTKILNDTKGTTPFVYRAIKQICMQRNLTDGNTYI